MNKENKIEELKEILKNLTENEIVNIWNEYCESNYYYDDRIEFMDDFDCLFEGKTPTEILEQVDSSFCICDNYFKFGIYGAESFDNPDDYIDYDDLANYILNNDEDFDNDEIQEFLDENNNEDDEEDNE